MVTSCASHGSTSSAWGAQLIGPDVRDTWYSVEAITHPGEVVSMGSVVELAPSVTKSVVLRSVVPLGVNGLVVETIVASGDERSFGMVGAVRGFPPPELAAGYLPIAGTGVPPGNRGVALTFALRKDQPGRGYVAGFEVTYTTGTGRVITQRFHQGMRLCAIPGYDASKSPSPSEKCDDLTPSERRF